MTSPSKEYSYFDTPDGEDTAKKLWIATKGAAALTLAVGTVDVFLWSHPKGYLQTLGRYAYLGIPIMGMTTAFVLITNMSTNIRGKDDKINWVAGALVSGGIFGAWRKSTIAGFTACSVLSLAAIAKKYALQNGWAIYDKPITRQDGGINSVRYDFSLIKERPRNWVTGK